MKTLQKGIVWLLFVFILISFSACSKTAVNTKAPVVMKMFLEFFPNPAFAEQVSDLFNKDIGQVSEGQNSGFN